MKLIVDIDGRREEYTVREGTVVFGRELDCDIPVVSTSVSRRHLEIHFEQGELTVRDLGSRNGVFVNDRKVQEAIVRPGEVVRAGRATLHFVRTGDMAQPPPAAGEGAMPASGGAESGAEEEAAPDSSQPPTPHPEQDAAASDEPTPPSVPALARQTDEPTPSEELPVVLASKPLAQTVITPLVRRVLVALLALTVAGVGIICHHRRRERLAAEEGWMSVSAYDSRIVEAVEMAEAGQTDEAAELLAQLATYRTEPERFTARYFLDALRLDAQLDQDFAEHWDLALDAWETMERNTDRPVAARDFAQKRIEGINREARHLALRDRALALFEEGDYLAFLQEAGKIGADSRFRREINQAIVDARSRLTRQLTEEADRLAEDRHWDEAIEALETVADHVPDMADQMAQRISRLSDHKADQARIAEARQALEGDDAAQAERALADIGDASPYAEERDDLRSEAALQQARSQARERYDGGNAQQALDILEQAGLENDRLARRIARVLELAERLDEKLGQYEFDRADAIAEEIVEREPNRENHYHSQAAGYLRDREGYRRRHAENLLAEAKTAHRQENYYEAREKAEGALRLFPRLQEAAGFIGTLRREAERIYNLEVLQHREGDPARALAAAKQVRDALRPGETFHTRAQQMIRELEARLREEEQ